MLSYLRTQSPAGEEHRREGSAPSDGVILSLESALAAETTDLTDRYCAICDSLRMPPHSGVLAFIRLRLAELRPRESEGFADRDMYAFCDFLLRELGAAKSVFDHWTRINLERCKIGPGGCRMLARVLRLPGCHVHTVNVSRQAIGAEGAAALVEAIRLNRSISMLDMKLAFVGDCGAAELLELIKDGEGAHNLTEIDLSNNMLTFPTCQQLMIACPKELKLVLKGNRVLDEVLNASSHLVGVILTIIGAIFLGMECHQLVQNGAGRSALCGRTAHHAPASLDHISPRPSQRLRLADEPPRSAASAAWRLAVASGARPSSRVSPFHHQVRGRQLRLAARPQRRDVHGRRGRPRPVHRVGGDLPHLAPRALPRVDDVPRDFRHGRRGHGGVAAPRPPHPRWPALQHPSPSVHVPHPRSHPFSQTIFTLLDHSAIYLLIAG